MIVIIEKLNSLDDRTTFTPASPWSFDDSGYVTWSSISWGLRPIQSAKTMTWFSDRSGMASTGIVIMARTPAIAIASEARMTRYRLRIDHSMIDSIMALAPSGSVPMGDRVRLVTPIGSARRPACPWARRP